jgi:hypothetical protein
MALKRRVNNEEDEKFWAFVDRTAKKAENYPLWKRGGENVETETAVPELGTKKVDCKIDSQIGYQAT